MKDVMRDVLFTNFLYSADLDIDLLKIRQECLDVKEVTPTLNLSNRGGWQGAIPSNQQDKELSKLQLKAVEFANFVSEKEQLDLKMSMINSWININYANDYNIPHAHGGADLVGVFYVNTPHPVGFLHILRLDGAAFVTTYVKKSQELEFILAPKAGRMYIFPPWLLHHVAPSPHSKDDRISIAINFKAILGESK